PLSSPPLLFFLSVVSFSTNCPVFTVFEFQRRPRVNMTTRPDAPSPGPTTTAATVYPAVESIDSSRSALPPPPYATAHEFPKGDERQPPSYQLQYPPELTGPPIVVYVDDGTGERCLLCGAPLHADVSYCALFCIILTVIITFPLGLVLLCCLPCLFTRKCVRCGELY
ncbi:hypothetical protein PFISCL1PPCAC_6554, partial [Pristionchus fissidentatus]